MAVRATPTVRWKPRLSILGFIGGLLLGASGIVLLQQTGKLYPSVTLLVVAVLIGALVGGVVVPSIFRLVAVGRVNGVINRINARGASAAGPPPTSAAGPPPAGPPPAGPPPSGPPPSGSPPG